MNEESSSIWIALAVFPKVSGAFRVKSVCLQVCLQRPDWFENSFFLSRMNRNQSFFSLA